MTPDELLLDALSDTWAQLQYRHDLPLAPPVFALHAGRTRLGLWMRGPRTISLSREHCLEDPWLDVVETLRHELAHQLVDEAMGGHERPHGERFQSALAHIGALPAADAEPSPVLDKVRKLLALAGSANQHEAELAMAKAQRLMLRHRIESAAVDGGQGFVRRQLGTPRRRQPRWRGSLAAALGHHFSTEIVSVPCYLPEHGDWGRVWELVGRPADVEMCTYAFDFVTGTAERLWAAHLATHPGAGRRRDRFLIGVVHGFATKLQRTEVEAQQEGLVMAADVARAAVVRRRFPSLSTTRGRFVADAHYHAGSSAGADVTLHRPIRSDGGGGGLLEG